MTALLADWVIDSPEDDQLTDEHGDVGLSSRNDLKSIYRAESAEPAGERLVEFGAGEWSQKYPAIAQA